jgi:type I restriction enzyme, S subunit
MDTTVGAVETFQCPIRRFKPYPSYRHSGVEWLGEMPAHWRLTRLKFSAHIEAGQSPPSELVIDGSEGLPFLQGNAEFGSLNPQPRQICDAAPKRAKSGDILLSVRAPVGALNIADQPYGIGRGLCAITRARCLDLRFGFYLLTVIRGQLDAVGTGSTYDAVTASEVGDLPTLLPALSEQHAIASFLDRETAMIDALLARKQRLIQLLQEKRTALITRAVTTGLHADVPVKDSGIESLGRIPAHWESRRLKFLTPQITVGIVVTPAKYYEPSGVPCLRSLNVREIGLSASDLVFISNESNLLLSKSRIFSGDLVAVRTGQAGTTAVVDDRFNG